MAFDPLWGAARGYSDFLLQDADVEVATVHDYPRRAFRRPCAGARRSSFGTFARKMRAMKAHVGIATDGDADRFGIVDEDGTFCSPTT